MEATHSLAEGRKVVQKRRRGRLRELAGFYLPRKPCGAVIGLILCGASPFWRVRTAWLSPHDATRAIPRRHLLQPPRGQEGGKHGTIFLGNRPLGRLMAVALDRGRALFFLCGGFRVRLHRRRAVGIIDSGLIAGFAPKMRSIASSSGDDIVLAFWPPSLLLRSLVAIRSDPYAEPPAR